MRVLFLTDNFPPETNAPAARTHEHAREWVSAGHEVTVITGVPNFPTGRVHDGYCNRWYSAELVDGIRVVRVKTLIAANEGVLLRSLDYLSFMLTGSIAGVFQQRPDVVIATSPQFFNAVGGWLVAALRRRPFVFEVRDLWPDSIVAVGALPDSIFIRLMSRIEYFLYRRAAAIVVVTNAFREAIAARGIDPAKIHVVLNGVVGETFAPREADVARAASLGLDGRFVAGYLGTHGMAHDLDHVLDAAVLLHDDDRIRFLFAGAGSARAGVERRVAEESLGNVVLLPACSREAVPDLLALCDVCLVPLRDSPTFATVIPSKLFEAMASATPVVMALPAGEATRIVQSTGAGIDVAPGNPAALANGLQMLADDPARVAVMSRAARQASRSYTREAGASRMLDVLRTIVGH